MIRASLILYSIVYQFQREKPIRLNIDRYIHNTKLFRDNIIILMDIQLLQIRHKLGMCKLFKTGESVITSYKILLKLMDSFQRTVATVHKS